MQPKISYFNTIVKKLKREMYQSVASVEKVETTNLQAVGFFPLFLRGLFWGLMKMVY